MHLPFKHFMLDGLLVSRLDDMLVAVDPDVRRASLASLLCWYQQLEADATIIELDQWRVLLIGPSQPLEVELHLAAIMELWRRTAHDAISTGEC